MESIDHELIGRISDTRIDGRHSTPYRTAQVADERIFGYSNQSSAQQRMETTVDSLLTERMSQDESDMQAVSDMFQSIPALDTRVDTPARDRQGTHGESQEISRHSLR